MKSFIAITIASILAMITYAIFGAYAVVAAWAFYFGMKFNELIMEDE